MTTPKEQMEKTAYEVRTRYDRDIADASRIHAEHGIISAELLVEELEKRRDRELSRLMRDYLDGKIVSE